LRFASFFPSLHSLSIFISLPILLKRQQPCLHLKPPLQVSPSSLSLSLFQMKHGSRFFLNSITATSRRLVGSPRSSIGSPKSVNLTSLGIRLLSTDLWDSQDSKFDRVLYRAGPPQVPTARGTTIKPHPIINEIDGIFLSLESAKMLETAKSSRTYHASSYPTILDEFATSPASTMIEISFTDPLYRTSDLYKAKGVTNRDFLQHLAEYWATSRKGNAIMSRRSQKVIDVARHLDPLVRRSLWTKWNFVQAQGGNETLFMADSFSVSFNRDVL